MSTAEQLNIDNIETITWKHPHINLVHDSETLVEEQNITAKNVEKIIKDTHSLWSLYVDPWNLTWMNTLVNARIAAIKKKNS